MDMILKEAHQHPIGVSVNKSDIRGIKPGTALDPLFKFFFSSDPLKGRLDNMTPEGRRVLYAQLKDMPIPSEFDLELEVDSQGRAMLIPLKLGWAGTNDIPSKVTDSESSGNHGEDVFPGSFYKLSPEFQSLARKNAAFFQYFPLNVVAFQGTPVTMDNTGGIDLTPERLGLETISDNPGLVFRMDPAVLERYQSAPGLEPVIINIQPMDNLSSFLGIQPVALKGG